jgi:hypothetical protein
MAAYTTNSPGCIKDLSCALFAIELSRHLSSSPPLSPHKATAARALATSPGAPSGAGGVFLPLYPAQGPLDSTKAGRLVVEEGDATASPTLWEETSTNFTHRRARSSSPRAAAMAPPRPKRIGCCSVW